MPKLDVLLALRAAVGARSASRQVPLQVIAVEFQQAVLAPSEVQDLRRLLPRAQARAALEAQVHLHEPSLHGPPAFGTRNQLVGADVLLKVAQPHWLRALLAEFQVPDAHGLVRQEVPLDV